MEDPMPRTDFSGKGFASRLTENRRLDQKLL